jgi:adenine-specific DNA-methyltransferase
MIKYLGSKRLLIPAILDAVAAVPGARTVLDVFSGTSRVGHALKRAGYRVIACDHAAYAHALGVCYVQADAQDVLDDAARLVAEFNALPGSPGYFTDTFCVKSRYIQPFNGERIDAIREAIARKGLGPELEGVMLASLIEAADRVDSTTGVQMAYLKGWSERSRRRLELRVPDVLPRAAAGKGRAVRLDAQRAADELEADVAYVDPPYNQHSYLGNYHVWESLTLWDKPEVYGVACKRVDVRERRSVFNSRPHAAAALRTLLGSLRVRAVVLSFSNEGFIGRDQIEAMLGALWGGSASVGSVSTEYPRYVGAKIGIYNPRGEKVGHAGHLSNTETTFLALPGTAPPADLRRPEHAPDTIAVSADKPLQIDDNRSSAIGTDARAGKNPVRSPVFG